MAITVLIGAQWGDEGKGKIIDVLTERVDWVVRFQGGNNAGHTVEVGKDRYVLHLLPSGILHAGKKCIVGNGVVVDPLACVAEIEELERRGVSVEGRLFISDRAHVVFPFHRLLDEMRERRAHESKKHIGTTKRGIGPAYGDKASRVGMRMGDFLEPDFSSKLVAKLREQNAILSAMGVEPFDETTVQTKYEQAAPKLRRFICDTITLVYEAINRGESILCEGAQGTMLDIDFGTYPYVTSSNSTVGGACTGAGIPPKCIDRVVGVLKGYTTRVGEGPFPTELKDESGAILQQHGREFGATTGRPRRCGWFDSVVARYAVMVNGVDCWALTKLDVLDVFETLRICVAYEYKGRRLDSIPASARILEQCRPIYEDLQGWNEPTTSVRRFEALPARARAYLARIEELTGVPVRWISLGPTRENIIEVRSP